jgi:sporulation protein YlmC with PRC-barrel domain
MVSISTISNTTQTVSTANSTATASTTTAQTTTVATPTITTTNSSTVKVSAAALSVAKAATASILTVSVADVLKSGYTPVPNTVIKDTAANIQTNLKAIAAIAPAANITGITMSDTAKATISVARADVKGDLSSTTNTDTVAVFLKKITTAYNLVVTGLTASDALTLKAPASSATLVMSVTDTAANLVTNLDALEAKVKTKSITALNIVADNASTQKPLIALTPKQLTADIDALKVLKGDFDLNVNGTAAADAATTAGAADAILKSAGSTSLMSKIAISDTSANIVTNIAKIELAGNAGRIISITVSDNKALVLTEAQILANTNTLNAQYTAPVKIEATGVAAADTSKVQTAVNSHTSLSLTKESISDTAANITAKLDDLEKLVLPSSASGSFTLASIGVSDKGSITVSNSTLLKDLDALKIVSGAYTLKLNDLAVADAIKITPPSKDATLSLTVSDTVSNVTANFDKLQTLAKAKSVSSITMTDASSSALKITSAQYKAGTEALGTLQGTYYLGITGVGMADMATSLKAKNIYSLDIADTSANVIKNLTALQAAVSSAKIQSVTLTDTASFTLSIADAYNLMTSLPNLTLGKNIKINIADTASNIVAHTRDDIGDILKNAGTITVTDKTTPNLTLADATTLKSLSSLASATKYNVIDSGTAIATQAKVTGEKILSGATAVTINHTYTIDDAKAVSSLGKGTSYGVADTVDKILVQQAVKGEKVVSGASFVNIVDTSANIVAKLDQIEALAKTGVITDIQFTDTPSTALSLTQDQLVKDAEAIGKIISQKTLPTLSITKPATPSSLGPITFDLNLPQRTNTNENVIINGLTPDGKKLFGQFQEYDNNASWDFPFITNTDGSGFINLTPNGATQAFSSGFTSDGQAYWGGFNDQYGQNHVYFSKTNGTQFKDLSPFEPHVCFLSGLSSDETKAWGNYFDRIGDSHPFIINVDGSGYVNLSPSGSIQPKIYGLSLDATQAWGQYQTQNGQQHAFIIKTDGTNYVDLTPQSALNSNIQGLSSDGKLAWGQFSDNSGGKYAYIIKSDGTGFKKLPIVNTSGSLIQDFNSTANLAWGQFYDNNGHIHIFTSKTDGTNFVDLTPENVTHAYLDGLSNDASKLFGYFYDNNDQSHIFVINPDGKGFTDLTPQGATGSRITGLSLDGKKVFGYYYDNNGNTHLFLTNTDGTGFNDVTPKGAMQGYVDKLTNINGKFCGIYKTTDQKWHGFIVPT